MSFGEVPFRPPPSPYSFVQMNKRLWGIVLPAICSQFFSLAYEVVGLLFVGQLNDKLKIAGVGIAIVYVNITCQSVLLGINSALTVLGARAFG